MVRLQTIRTIPVVLLLVGASALGLSFTGFYGIAYLLSIIVLSLYLPTIRVFSSLFSRIVLALLLLLGIIMIGGIFAWLANLPLYPAAVVSITLLLAIFSKRYSTFEYRQASYIDKADLWAGLLALLAPAIIYLSFFAPNYTDAALYQFLSNGWDNSSHIAILESTSLHDAYTSNLSPNKHNLDSFGSGYPQGWHLATSSFIDGFGNWLDTSKPITVMRAYALAMVVWFVIAAYLLTIIGYRLLNFSKQKMTVTQLATLLAASLLLQTMTVLGALLLGFSNFIGLLAYVLVSVALLVSYERSDNHKPMPILLMTTLVAGILCWFLPLPALLATLVLFVIFMHKGDKDSMWTFIKKNKVMLLFVAAVTGVALLSQLYMYLQHTVIGGAAQLNVPGGVYKNSPLLLAAFVAIAALYVQRNLPKRVFYAFICLALPIVLVVGGLYVYQYISSGKLSYYYFKLLIVLALIAGVFFIAAIAHYAKVLDKHLTNCALKIACSIGIILVAIITTGQTFSNEAFLFQRNSAVSSAVSQKVIDHLEKGNFQKNKLVIFTDRKYENYNGELYSLVTYMPLTCAHQIVNLDLDGNPASTKPKAVVKRINECAATTGLTIEVVTNMSQVESLIKATGNSNIQITKVKE